MYVCICMAEYGSIIVFMYVYAYMNVWVCMYVCMYVCIGENDQDGEVVNLIKTLTYLKPSRRSCPSHVLAHMKLFQYSPLIADEKTRDFMVHTLFHLYIHTYTHTVLLTYVLCFINTNILSYVYTFIHTYIITIFLTSVLAYIHNSGIVLFTVTLLWQVPS